MNLSNKIEISASRIQTFLYVVTQSILLHVRLENETILHVDRRLLSYSFAHIYVCGPLGL